MSVDRLELIIPDWPGAENVKAFTTTRGGGVSSAPWYSFNLGDHVGDDPGDVMSNRDTLLREGNLPAMPLWLKQVHGCDVADAESASTGCIADAAYADEPGKGCAVLTADCLPLLLADRRGAKSLLFTRDGAAWPPALSSQPLRVSRLLLMTCLPGWVRRSGPMHSRWVTM